MSGNGLSPLYITGVDLNQYFVSNQTAEALANGVIYFYVDSNRVQAKTVYQLVQGSGSPPNYTYVPLPNPVTLSAVGTIMDANGNNCALYYYPYDSFGNVQLYYIECYDQFGNLQFTREAWPYLSTTGGGMSGTINSAAQNSIAWYATTGTTISGIPTANSSVFITSNTGVPGWTQTLPSQVAVTVNSLDNGTSASSTTYWAGDGTWKPITDAGNTVLVETITASSSATLDLTDVFSSAYDQYLVTLTNVVPATDATTLGLQFGTGAGPTWITANYTWNSLNTSAVSTNNTSDSKINLIGSNGSYAVSNTAGFGVNGTLWVSGPDGASNSAFVTSNLAFYLSGGTYAVGAFNVGTQAAATFTSVRFLFSSGNIASGTIAIYGLVKS